MTSSSHLASSSLCYLIASAITNSPIQAEGLAVTAVASILPDIDTPTSLVGRPFFPIAGWIDRKLGHRTITHSFLGMAIFALVVFGLERLLRPWIASTQPYAWCLSFGYSSHILVDMLNKTGVELFWPTKWRCVVFANEQYRIAAAGKGDYWFMTACLVLNLAVYPVARDGFHAFPSPYVCRHPFGDDGLQAIWRQSPDLARPQGRRCHFQSKDPGSV